MVSGKHTGEWFLPNGKKYPGQLIIDNDTENITLEIFGIEFIEGGTTTYPNAHPQHFHPIILGTCTGNTTLYNCHWSGSEEIGKGIYRITYNIEFVFSGVHFLNQDIPVRTGTFVFPNLSTWYDGSEFLNKLEGRQGLIVDGKHIVQNALTTDTIKINDALTLQLWDEVNKRIDKMNISYKVIYSKYIRFQYELDVPIQSLMKDAITFLKLLAFCFGNPLTFKIIYVHTAKKNVSSDRAEYELERFENLLIHVNNYTLKNKKEIESHSSHSRYMLLSKWTCNKEELNQIIINWFNNERLYNIYEYYLDSNNWFQGTDTRLSNVMFNNRFLNLIQGLEDYFREFFEVNLTAADQLQFTARKKAIIDQITDASLKKWLNDTFKFTKYPKLEEKLISIIKDLTPDLSVLFDGIPLNEFPRLAAHYRNILSHGLNKGINLGRQFHKEYYIAQVLLGTCILKTLSVSDIKSRVAYYSKFVDAANEIHFMQNQSTTFKE